MTTSALPALFRLLSDSTRLRVLGLLGREELGVSELARILGLSPSRLSNHLRILREANLVQDRKEGSWTFVSLNRDGALPTDLWSAVEAELAQSQELATDLERLAEVLEERRARSRAYFDRVAPDWDVIGSDFATGVARQRVAASLVPQTLTVADVGCGTGYLAHALAPLVKKLILVDHSPAMLEAAQKNLAGTRAELEFRAGEIDALPLTDNEADGLLAGMVLHHAPDATAFFREAYRVLKPGGMLVVEDLLPHKEAWMRDTMADLRLGLDPNDLKSRLLSCGFENPEVESLEDTYTPEHPNGTRVDLPLFLLRARKQTREELLPMNGPSGHTENDL